MIGANGLSLFASAAEVFRMLVPERKQDIETYVSLYTHGPLDYIDLIQMRLRRAGSYSYLVVESGGRDA